MFFFPSVFLRFSYFGRWEQLAQTIAEGGEEPVGDDAHRDDVTALMVAAQGGHEAVVKLLVERGADVRSKDEEGFTPLLNAVKVRRGI